MNITLTITGGTAAEIKEAVNELSTTFITSNGTAIELPAKNKSKKSTVSEKAIAPGPWSDPEPKEIAAEQNLTLEEVRAIATDVAKTGKRVEVKALITEFGAKNLEGIKPEHFTEFITKVKAL